MWYCAAVQLAREVGEVRGGGKVGRGREGKEKEEREKGKGRREGK